MKRRRFLGIMGIAGVAVGMSPSLLSASNRASGNNAPMNWAWVNGAHKRSDDEVKKLIDGLLDGGIDAMLPEGDYERYGKLAEGTGIKVHAWRWTMNRGKHMEAHPDWYAVNRNGESVIDKPPYVGYYRFLCPSTPEVKQLLIDDYSQIAQINNISGVHFDYVRYCDIYLPTTLQPNYGLVQDHEMPEYDYCYCDKCRKRFKDEYGQDPLDFEDPSANKEWHEFRLKILSDLIRSVVDELHARNIYVSGAVFPTPDMARRNVRQDWPKFGFDTYMPMLYNNFYNEGIDWIWKGVKEGVKEIGPNQNLYAGVMSGEDNTNNHHINGDTIEKLYDKVIKNGGSGLSFFTGPNIVKNQGVISKLLEISSK